MKRKSERHAGKIKCKLTEKSKANNYFSMYVQRKIDLQIY